MSRVCCVHQYPILSVCYLVKTFQVLDTGSLLPFLRLTNFLKFLYSVLVAVSKVLQGALALLEGAQERACTKLLSGAQNTNS